MKKEEIYNYLKLNLTAENLKEFSVDIIAAYKNKDINILSRFAKHMNITLNEYGGKMNLLFLKLIKLFHPDKLNYFILDIEDSFRKDKIDKLLFYKNLLSIKREVKPAPRQRQFHSTEYKEAYDFDMADFDYETDEEYFDVVDEYFDFIKAVKAVFLGNLDVDFELSDLVSIEGELILSGYGIFDLYGLQYCTGITSLNLSDNNIDNFSEIRDLTNITELFMSNNNISDINYLENLVNLEILELSGNKIEDIKVLLCLKSLKFLDISNNPVKTKDVITVLEKNGVYVIS